jgi:hypothetical protein
MPVSEVEVKIAVAKANRKKLHIQTLEKQLAELKDMLEKAERQHEQLKKKVHIQKMITQSTFVPYKPCFRGPTCDKEGCTFKHD